jgi:hypothetical protein
MEPLDENELKQLLRKWEAPPAPPTLEQRVLPPQKGLWWKWLWSGSVRVPVPVAIAVAVVVVFWIYYTRPANVPQIAQPETVSLSDFKPVRQLEPVLVQGGQK